MTDLDRLEGLMERATALPWQLQDGCSWRRIGTAFHDGDVLCPIKQNDGHPDLMARDGRTYDNLRLIVEAVNALPSLIARLKAAEEALGKAEDRFRFYERHHAAKAVGAARFGMDTPERAAALEKADRNREMADMCAAARASLKEIGS